MSSRAPLLWLALYLAVLAVQRFAEVAISLRHARALLARGARESGAGHYGLFVLLHAGWPLMLIWEVLARGARPGPWWPLALLGVLAAAGLRQASMRALGGLWTARIVVLPDQPRVTHGIYRWLAYPSYAGATLELIAAPLMFGAWRTALAAWLVNAVALAIRMPAQRRALEQVWRGTKAG